MENNRSYRRSERNKRERFSIRKFNVGVASVAVAAFWMVSGQVAADTTDAVTATDATVEVVESAEEASPVADEEPASEVVAEEVAETPAEEVVAEEVAETPAEEVAAEEVAETPAEEVAAEEVAETPAEEAKEEAVEEAKEEVATPAAETRSAEPVAEAVAETPAEEVAEEATPVVETRTAATTYRVQYVDEAGSVVKQQNYSVAEETTNAADEPHTFNVNIALETPAGYEAVSAANNAGTEFDIVNNAIAAAIVEKDSSSRTIKVTVREDQSSASNNSEEEGYTALFAAAENVAVSNNRITASASVDVTQSTNGHNFVTNKSIELVLNGDWQAGETIELTFENLGSLGGMPVGTEFLDSEGNVIATVTAATSDGTGYDAYWGQRDGSTLESKLEKHYVAEGDTVTYTIQVTDRVLNNNNTRIAATSTNTTDFLPAVSVDTTVTGRVLVNGEEVVTETYTIPATEMKPSTSQGDASVQMYGNVYATDSSDGTRTYHVYGQEGAKADSDVVMIRANGDTISDGSIITIKIDDTTHSTFEQIGAFDVVSPMLSIADQDTNYVANENNVWLWPENTNTNVQLQVVSLTEDTMQIQVIGEILPGQIIRFNGQDLKAMGVNRVWNDETSDDYLNPTNNYVESTLTYTINSADGTETATGSGDNRWVLNIYAQPFSTTGGDDANLSGEVQIRYYIDGTETKLQENSATKYLNSDNSQGNRPGDEYDVTDVVAPETITAEDGTVYYLVRDSGNQTGTLVTVTVFVDYYYAPATVEEETETVTRNIQYFYETENGEVASATVTETLTYTREITKHPVTGEVISTGDWTSADNTLDAVDSPVINGYDVDRATVDAQTITDPTTIAQDANGNRVINEVVIYTAANEEVVEETTATRTIVYVYETADGAEAAPTVVQEVPVKFTRTNIVNKVTGEVVTEGTWSEAQTLDAVTSPVIAGYTAGTEVVPAATVNANDALNVVVIYTKDAQKAVINYVLEGDEANPLATVNEEGLSSEAISATAYQTTLEELLAQGYELVSDDFNGSANYDADKTVDQTFTVVLRQGETVTTAEETATRKLVVTYVYDEDGTTAAETVEKEVTFTRTVTTTTNKVTGEVTVVEGPWSDAQTFGQIDSPAITGFQPNILSVLEYPVTTANPEVETVEVRYIRNPQRAIFNYVLEGTNEFLVAEDTVREDGRQGLTIPADNYQAALDALLAQGYELVSDEFATSDKTFTNGFAEQGVAGFDRYTIVLREGMITVDPNDPNSPAVPEGVTLDALTEEVTRVITYVYEDGSEAAPTVTQVTETFTRTATINLVTKAVTYSEWTPAQDLAEVVSPVIAGYTASDVTVPVATVNATDADLAVQVVYVKNGQQIVKVNYVDEAGTALRISDVVAGPAGIEVTNPTASRVEELLKAGYELVVNPFDTTTFIFDEVSDEGVDTPSQIIDVVFKERIVDVPTDVVPGQPVDPTDPNSPLWPATLADLVTTAEVTRTITYVYEDGTTAQETITETVEFTRTAQVNLVTGEIIYSDWSAPATLAEVVTPEIAGYTADKATVVASEVNADSADITEVVTYVKDAQKATITFTTDAGVELNVLVEEGKSGEPISAVAYQALLDELKKAGYEVTSDDFNGVADFDLDKLVDQAFNVVVTPRVVPVDGNAVPGQPVDPTDPNSPVWPDTIADLVTTKEVTRTISYVNAKGETVFETVTQTVTFTREASVNLVTGEITYGEWTAAQDLAAVVSPELARHTVDTAVVDLATVNAEDADIAVVVTYTFAPVTNFVDEAGNPLAPEADGVVDPAVIDGYYVIDTIVDENGDVTHVYRQVTTSFVDQDGNPIAPVVDGAVDPAVIDGYEFVETIVDENGNVTHVYMAAVSPTAPAKPEAPKAPVAPQAPKAVKETPAAKPAKAEAPKYVTEETKSLPNTGEESNAAAVAGLGILMSALGLGGLRRRKED